MLLFGVDRIDQYPQAFRGRLALLTTPSGRTRDNRSTIDVLAQQYDLKCLLAPEHGVRGDKAAGALFEEEIDPETGLPIYSLYTQEAKRLRPQLLEKFDTLVYDIADVGCRYYTFLSTLRYCIEDCGRAGKGLVVLDRPNPLGDGVEGGLLQPECASFVGDFAIPVRYGLTCGELAEMMNRELGAKCDLTVIPCAGLTREMTFRDWGHYWVMPSLGIPRFETALLYPGTCLLEGTNLSEGRGTADPFVILGAPFIRAEEFCRRFNALELPGVVATPVYFTPVSSKHAHTLCGGIHLHIVDEEALTPVALGVRLLDLVRTMYPEDFRFLPPNEGEERPMISLLAGHREFEDPAWDAQALLERYARESEAFRSRKEAYHRYPRRETV